VPVGGLDSIAPFVSLFAGQEQQIAVLTDGLMSHPHRLDGLWDRGVLQFGRILRPALYTEREDAQLEDLLGRGLFRELVTGAYARGVGVLDEGPAPAAALVAEVEAYFASMPPWAPRFDSFAPAAYLFENTATLRATLPDVSGSPRPVREALPRPAQPVGAIAPGGPAPAAFSRGGPLRGTRSPLTPDRSPREKPVDASTSESRPRTPNPGPRSPESRVPGFESPIPNPQSPIPNPNPDAMIHPPPR